MRNQRCVGRFWEALAILWSMVLLPAAGRAQGSTSPYPSMAPIAQYRMTAAAEIAMARSAAPESISANAAILVLGDSGYETAVKGRNGFVCFVERSWANDFGNADFWNPKNRAPNCFNAAAARSVLPAYLTRTKWVLAGQSQAQMAARVTGAPAASGIRAPEPGAMVYMLSKDGYLGDNVKGPWHPHLMFFLDHAPASAWGANVDHSPVVLLSAPGAAVTVFLVQVPSWSDGSTDTPQ